MSVTAARNLRIYILCLYYPVLVILMRYRLRGSNKTSSHLNCFRSEHKGRRHSTAISYTACRDHGNFHCINHLRHKCHCSSLTYMSSGLGSLGYDCIDSAPLHELSQSNAGNYRDHHRSGFLPHAYVFSGIACTRCNYLYAFFRDNLGDLVCLGVHEHKVYSKRLIRLLLAGPYLIPYPCRRCSAGAYYTKASCV